MFLSFFIILFSKHKRNKNTSEQIYPAEHFQENSKFTLLNFTRELYQKHLKAKHRKWKKESCRLWKKLSVSRFLGLYLLYFLLLSLCFLSSTLWMILLRNHSHMFREGRGEFSGFWLVAWFTFQSNSRCVCKQLSGVKVKQKKTYAGRFF